MADGRPVLSYAKAGPKRQGPLATLGWFVLIFFMLLAFAVLSLAAVIGFAAWLG